MKKILAFGATNSKKSINKTFATYVAHKLTDVEVIVADLNDYKLPLYSPDLEKESGMHGDAIRFDNLLASVDGLVISLAEYNGNYTTAFKNLFDWLSRIDMRTIWKNKPLLLLSTSPGGRGGQNVMKISKELLPHFGGNIVTDFSLPFFSRNFQNGAIVDQQKLEELNNKIQIFQQSI